MILLHIDVHGIKLYHLSGDSNKLIAITRQIPLKLRMRNVQKKPAINIYLLISTNLMH